MFNNSKAKGCSIFWVLISFFNFPFTSLLVKGKLHSKIISSDMKDFFRRIQWWRSEVEIRTGRRSNRRSKMAEKSRMTTPRGRHESWCQASAVRGCVPILINPEFDAALDRESCVTHWMSSPGSALWCTDIWQSFFFFFFVVSWVLFDKTVTEYRVWRKVHGTAEEVRCYPQIPGW